MDFKAIMDGKGLRDVEQTQASWLAWIIKTKGCVSGPYD